MNYNKFQIAEFDLKKMVDHPAIVMIAKRGTGKSWITRDIMYHYKHIPGGVVIAPTDRMNSFYNSFFPDIYIHYEIKPALLNKILIRQTIMIQKEEDKKKRGLKVNPSGILIMDDCLASKKTWAKDQNIMEILMNGRHYKLTYVLTMQTPLGITPDLRLNFDYVFLLKEDSSINIKKIYENYASMFPNKKVFCVVFTQCTKDYRSMVIDNRRPTDTVTEKVFWFKAGDHKFKFGSKEFNSLHDKYYNPKHIRQRADAQLADNNRLLGGKPNEMDIKVEMVK